MDSNESERPPLRINNRQDVYTADRDLRSITDAYIYMAAIPCKEVKFNVTSELSKAPRGCVSDLDYVIEDSIPTAADLLHGFSFPVSVLKFRLWIEEQIEQKGDGPKELKSREINIIDLRNSNKAVKEVRFDPPVVLTPQFRYRISYVPNPRDFYGSKTRLDYSASEHFHLTAPRLSLSLLAEDERRAVREGMLVKSYLPLPKDIGFSGPVDKDAPIEDRKPQYSQKSKWLSISVRPTVILRDGSIYDKNVTEIDLQEFTIRH